jgi:hypothetical protein
MSLWLSEDVVAQLWDVVGRDLRCPFLGLSFELLFLFIINDFVQTIF